MARSKADKGEGWCSNEQPARPGIKSPVGDNEPKLLVFLPNLRGIDVMRK
jgi:hypothetical protein